MLGKIEYRNLLTDQGPMNATSHNLLCVAYDLATGQIVTGQAELTEAKLSSAPHAHTVSAAFRRDAERMVAEARFIEVK